MNSALNTLLNADGSRSSQSRPSMHPETARSQAIHKRVRIQVPPQYHGEPVITNLAVMYELQVNIVGAFLAANSSESGWFDVQLRGTPARVDAGLAYLSSLQVEFLDDADQPAKTWSLI